MTRSCSLTHQARQHSRRPTHPRSRVRPHVSREHLVLCSPRERTAACAPIHLHPPCLQLPADFFDSGASSAVASEPEEPKRATGRAAGLFSMLPPPKNAVKKSTAVSGGELHRTEHAHNHPYGKARLSSFARACGSGCARSWCIWRVSAPAYSLPPPRHRPRVRDSPQPSLDPLLTPLLTRLSSDLFSSQPFIERARSTSLRRSRPPPHRQLRMKHRLPAAPVEVAAPAESAVQAARPR